MSFKLTTVGATPLFIRMLLYGPEGTQKTSWCGENAPNPVWVDFEHSTDVLKARGLTHIPLLEYQTMEDIKNFVKSKELKQFETLVFDTISSLQDFQLFEHMTKKYGITNEKRLLPLFQDFRISTQVFKEILLLLQGLEMNFVIIAHEREFYQGEGEDKKLIGIGPSITPALSDSVRQAVGCVGRMSIEKVGQIGNKTSVRRIMFNPQGLYKAKNRYNIQETTLDNPTWETLKGNFTDAN